MTTEYGKGSFINFDTLVKLIESEGSDRLKLIDATYRASPSGEPAYEAYQNGHIHNASYFDIDKIADQNAPFAHTMPSPEEFAKAMAQMGINEDDLVVIYDQGGICMAASRVWWMFQTFGHRNSFLLNGGLPEWLRHGLPLNTEPFKAAATSTYNVHEYRSGMITRTQDILDIISGKKEAIIIDARAESRFGDEECGLGCGTDTGHIPGSLNLHFMDLIDPQTARMHNTDRLKEIFAEYIPPPSSTEKIVFTCGSGVTACILGAAAVNAGFKLDNLSVYDGSWTEWSQG